MHRQAAKPVIAAGPHTSHQQQQLLHALVCMARDALHSNASRAAAATAVAAAAAAAVAAKTTDDAAYNRPRPAAMTAPLVGAILPSNNTLTLQAPELSLPMDVVVKPALHGKQRALPSDVLYVPKGQSLHACARGLSVYWPAGHIMHSVDPGL